MVLLATLQKQKKLLQSLLGSANPETWQHEMATAEETKVVRIYYIRLYRVSHSTSKMGVIMTQRFYLRVKCSKMRVILDIFRNCVSK